ncbi:helix-turn-helix transcriptional regulator [Merdibacter massiliensis]
MINENIKYYRKRKGISQEEMAVKLHVVRQTVSKWENGGSLR